MKVKYSPNLNNSSDLTIIERKGIGHPDTLADMVAETFSNTYSKYCIDNFGVVLNHWVDKVVLRGGKAKLGFKECEIIEPIGAYLFGRTTKMFGDKVVPIEKIFKDSVRDVFSKVFFTEQGILDDVIYHVDVNDSVGADHPKGFYNPQTLIEAKDSNSNPESNDTVICSGNAPYNMLEFLTINLENYLNSREFKKIYPMTGFDIKVLSAVVFDSVNITICIPFISSKIESYEKYNLYLSEIREIVLKMIQDAFPGKSIELDINTKDKGKYAYLTVFGTSLDKGDYGAVGRGNRRNGLIHSNRSMSLEAVSGKNPINHSGKLYNEVAQKVANEVYQKYKLANTVHIVAKNGDYLKDPSLILIESKGELTISEKTEIEAYISELLNSMDEVSKNVIYRDVIEFYTKPDLIFSKE